MSKKASPTIIGIFTLAGLIIAAVGLMLFGAGAYFKKSYPILLYFEMSANGLQVGSDVRFGGVRIGRVRSINVIIYRDQNRKIIPVVVELGKTELSLIGTEKGGGIDFSTQEGVAKAVKEGLRAGMKQQSLVTGQLYIEFDIAPDTPGFIYQDNAEPPYPVVPTIATEMDRLIAGISDGLKKFNDLDLDSVMSELRDVLVSVNKQVGAIDIKEINDNITAITRDVRGITSDEKLGEAVGNLNQALSEAERATRALKELTADLKRNPSTLLRGKTTPK